MRVLLVVLMVFCSGAAPTQESIPLGDFGSITYPSDEHPPDARRTASLIVFLFDQFPDVDVPPTQVEILTFERYEESIAMIEAGPGWQRWLAGFRQQIVWMASAVTEVTAAREWSLKIKAYHPLSDQVLMHEMLHFVYEQLSPQPIGDTTPLNTEAIVVMSTGAMMTSLRYRAWLRERPWLELDEQSTEDTTTVLGY